MQDCMYFIYIEKLRNLNVFLIILSKIILIYRILIIFIIRVRSSLTDLLTFFVAIKQQNRRTSNGISCEHIRSLYISTKKIIREPHIFLKIRIWVGVLKYAFFTTHNKINSFSKNYENVGLFLAPFFWENIRKY